MCEDRTGRVDCPALAHRGDGISPRRQSAPVSLLSSLIEAFHSVVSPWLSASCGWGCRFEPTCSQYARQALSCYGLWRGGCMAAYRLLRCNPLGGHGYDPVDRGSVSYLNRPQE